MNPPRHSAEAGTGGVAGRTASGFTLIELVLVIAVMMLAMTALIPLLSSRAEERQLKDAADRIERLARSARASAVYAGRPATLRFSEDGFTLVAAARKDVVPDAPEDTFFTERPSGGEAGGSEDPVEEEVVLPGEVTLRVRRWASDEWVPPEDMVWRFHASGLCEPLGVRFESGESWIELAFSPLTAEVVEESYAFP